MRRTFDHQNLANRVHTYCTSAGLPGIGPSKIYKLLIIHSSLQPAISLDLTFSFFPTPKIPNDPFIPSQTCNSSAAFYWLLCLLPSPRYISVLDVVDVEVSAVLTTWQGSHTTGDHERRPFGDVIGTSGLLDTVDTINSAVKAGKIMLEKVAGGCLQESTL